MTKTDFGHIFQNDCENDVKLQSSQVVVMLNHKLKLQHVCKTTVVIGLVLVFVNK